MVSLRCRCTAVFTHPSEAECWQMHREHAAAAIEMDDGAVHDVVEFGKPFTGQVYPSNDMAEVLDWVAAMVHAAYHESHVAHYYQCSHMTCIAVTDTLKKAGYAVPMPRVLPEVFAPRRVGGADRGTHDEPA